MGECLAYGGRGIGTETCEVDNVFAPATYGLVLIFNELCSYIQTVSIYLAHGVGNLYFRVLTDRGNGWPMMAPFRKLVVPYRMFTFIMWMI